MKRGPRKPRHASSVRATTSKECFSPKAGYKSSFHKGADFGCRPAAFPYFVGPDSLWNPKQTPSELLALLLLALPLLFTLQKLLELFALGERSHHQFAVQDNSNMTRPV